MCSKQITNSRKKRKRSSKPGKVLYVLILVGNMGRVILPELSHGFSLGAMEHALVYRWHHTAVGKRIQLLQTFVNQDIQPAAAASTAFYSKDCTSFGRMGTQS